MRNRPLKMSLLAFSMLMMTGCGGEGSAQNATSEYLLANGSISDSSPTADIAKLSEKVTQGDSVMLDARQSNDKDGDIVSYDWIFLDGTTLGKGEVLEYDTSTLNAGTHSIQLKVTDDAANTDTKNITLVIEK